mgnify:FL=1
MLLAVVERRANGLSKSHDVIIATNLNIPVAYQLDNRVKLHSLYPSNYSDLNKVIRIPCLYYRINRTVVHYQPDVIISLIHIMNMRVILANLFSKIPIIACEHTSYERKLDVISNLARRYVDRLADKLVLLTQRDYKYLNDRYKGGFNNTIVINNPCSFSPTSKMKICYKKKQILAVGRLNDWYVKGFDNLLLVWSKIAPIAPEWCLVIAGDGDDNSKSYLNKITSKYQIEEQVIFIGFVSDIKKIYLESSIFVLSSRNEGMPMCLIEAMSQGCAVASFDCVSGPKELITHEKNGLLVKNQDNKDMEKAIVRLMTNDKLRNELACSAIQESYNYSIDKILEKWNILFDDLNNK